MKISPTRIEGLSVLKPHPSTTIEDRLPVCFVRRNSVRSLRHEVLLKSTCLEPVFEGLSAVCIINDLLTLK